MMQHPWNEVICDMQRLHWPWHLIQALALSSKLVNIMTVQQENIQHWLTMMYLICLRIFSDNHDGRAASAPSWSIWRLLKPLSAHPGMGLIPKPTLMAPWLSFSWSLYSSFEVVCIVLACSLLYSTYVKKQQQQQISRVALLLRDLHRTRACPLIAESVKSIVRVLFCNVFPYLATSLLPATNQTVGNDRGSISDQ